MQTSSNGIALIERFEGLRLTAYQDVVGIWTIGYGHTGSDVHPGLSISQIQAAALLQGDLTRFEAGVGRAVTVPLNQNQFDALVSFSYNLGLANLQHSTLLRRLNAGHYDEAAQEFPKWCRAGGKVLPGLVKRRSMEQTLFLTQEH
ncbi:lysozyme [Chitinolyticbacter albus]|uniref:lysozyme n=1 Tax=Chitinolyticbacter albus TaxID=2961951 RepID=UPI00210A0DE3|nr:lysozyme [Chitinolyticbacter albus]